MPAMIRIVFYCLSLLIVAAGLSPKAFANGIDNYPALINENVQTLNIVGTTDRPLFAPFVHAFQKLNPNIAICYEEMESGEIYQGIINDSLNPKADLVISSAVDLQVKLANDGYAMAYDSPYAGQLPSWAHWRNELFGFTFEPAIIAYNRRYIKDSEAPHTHLQLAKLLEDNRKRFNNRVGTYDIELSGVGYVTATHDEFISSNFWRLTNAFAASHVKLSNSTPLLLDWLESGNIVIAYNLLGSYTFARSVKNPDIGIIVPDDYALVLTRSVLIPRGSTKPAIAKQFVDFLLSPHGQSLAASDIGFGSIISGTNGRFTSEKIIKMSRGAVQPIAMSPTLLVAYDRQKREQFLRVWRDIILKGEEAAQNNRAARNEKPEQNEKQKQ